MYVDGVDYISMNQIITFPPNETCVSISVDIIDDGIHEENETFIATLKRNESSFDGVFIGTPSTAVGIIIDDDELCKCMHVFLCWCKMLLYVRIYYRCSVSK